MKQHNTEKALVHKRPAAPPPATAPHDDAILRELRAAQTALEASNLRYAELYNNAPVAYVTLDAAGVIRSANRAAENLLGYMRSELCGKTFRACLERGQRARISRYLDGLVTCDGENRPEIRMRRAGGASRSARLIGVAWHNTASGARACRIALTDVGEEKQQQETLRLHSLIMKHIVEGVVLVRAADGLILEANPSFERMFGYDADELIGRHISAINAANAETPQDIAARIISSVKHFGQWEGEVHSVRKDGSKFWTQAAVTGFVHSIHGPVWVCVQRDITERKRAEQLARERQDELAHVLRLNTVGELAATLAHELTQPVMAIEHFNHAAIGLAESGNGAGEEMLQLLRSADQQVKRAGDVIRQLRKFVRRGVVEKKPISVSRTIDEALQLLHPMIVGRGVEVHATCGADVPLVNADPVQIEQVLVNLLRNSVEAMTTSTTTAAPRCVDISCLRHDGSIEVVLRDNGPGLDPAREASLFNVLESKKVDGMGMGLAISRSIIQAHGGKLWAEPAAAGGATFRFTLPVCS